MTTHAPAKSVSEAWGQLASTQSPRSRMSGVTFAEVDGERLVTNQRRVTFGLGDVVSHKVPGRPGARQLGLVTFVMAYEVEVSDEDGYLSFVPFADVVEVVA